MNSGIIRKALTTTLALELEYREPFIVREVEASPSGAQNFNSCGDGLTIEFEYPLNVI
ncbi:MAG TPA: hypothetical protein VMU26_16635 [Candidatus Polarisedimenticolia bacterium]|nr:hypothetical protein [Candidatus Polarisedimenticolia bacterium]